jgi:hypothetical protein
MGNAPMNRQQRRAAKVTARGSDAELDVEISRMLTERPGLVREIMEDLEHEGLIYDTGQRRNGQIVYAATPRGKERN